MPGAGAVPDLAVPRCKSQRPRTGTAESAPPALTPRGCERSHGAARPRSGMLSALHQPSGALRCPVPHGDPVPRVLDGENSRVVLRVTPTSLPGVVAVPSSHGWHRPAPWWALSILPAQPGSQTSPLPPRRSGAGRRPRRKELLSLIVPSSAGSDNSSFLPHASGRAVGLAARGCSHGDTAWCGAAPQLQPARCPILGVPWVVTPASPTTAGCCQPGKGLLPLPRVTSRCARPRSHSPPPAGLRLSPRNPVPTPAHRLICWLIPQAINTALPRRALQPPCWPPAHPPLSPKREGGRALLPAGGEGCCWGAAAVPGAGTDSAVCGVPTSPWGRVPFPGH